MTGDFQSFFGSVGRRNRINSLSGKDRSLQTVYQKLHEELDWKVLEEVEKEVENFLQDS